MSATKLIMGFMGVKPSMDSPDVYTWNNGVFFSVREDNPDKVVDSVAKYLEDKYKLDWNWLMDVVLKIEQLGYPVDIFNNTCSITDVKSEPPTMIVDIPSRMTKIDAVYEAVVEFTEWYKKNK